MATKYYRLDAINNKDGKLYFSDFGDSKEFYEDFFLNLIIKYIEGRYCIDKTFKLIEVNDNDEVIISEVRIIRG